MKKHQPDDLIRYEHLARTVAKAVNDVTIEVVSSDPTEWDRPLALFLDKFAPT